MQVISTVADLRQRLRGETSIAFVPTMGNLHEGHLDLVRIARDRGKCVVVSILQQSGVHVVFTPTEQELYPCPQQVTVAPPLENQLCGEFRPGHFRGVATVVLKLFNIVQPQIAVFGKKDYQQLYVIRQVAMQLNLPVEIVGGETLRADDGLALSSRNHYLSATERTEAVFLYQTLMDTRQAVLGGSRDFASLERQAVQSLAARGWKVDYVAIRDQNTLLQPKSGERELVILAAARLGHTRLIDNLEVCI